MINDRRIKVRDIVLFILIDCLWKNLKTHMKMQQLSSKWLSQSLTIEIKHICVSFSKECLEKLKQNPNENPYDFWRRFITFNNTSIDHSIPKTIKQSKKWVFVASLRRKMLRWLYREKNVMITVFLDVCGIISSVILKKIKIINAKYLAYETYGIVSTTLWN